MNKDILLYHKSLNFIDKTNYNYSNNKLKNNSSSTEENKKKIIFKIIQIIILPLMKKIKIF
jgi:hypothetical protein